MFAFASDILFVPLIRAAALAKPGYMNPRLIRIPGALEEREFLRACIKCGECTKVCITNGLQPTLLEAGPEGIWSPVLIPPIGYREYRCTLCGQVCPTSSRAIWLEETTMRNRDGKAVRMKRPPVDLELCIGCGICETLRPVIGKPAICVTNVGESRSRAGRLLLPGAAEPVKVKKALTDSRIG